MDVFERGSPAALFAALAAGAAIKFAANYAFEGKKKKDNNYRYVGKIGALYLYPFKSLKSIRIDEGEVGPTGLHWKGLGDRQWAIASENGNSLTQKMLPRMALIQPSLKGDLIQLTAPGMEPITFPAFPEPTEGNLSKVTVSKDTVPSVDLGNEVSEWMSRFLEKQNLRLHYSAPSLEKRDSSKAVKNWPHQAKPGDLTLFSNYCAYMVLSSEALTVLNSKLVDKAVPIDNFRPNIVVEDCKAFAEDSWSSVRIGESQLRVVDSCTRCPLTTVDQEKGVMDEKGEPLATLKSFRLKEPFGPKPIFGTYFAFDKAGTIKVGDAIYAIIE